MSKIKSFIVHCSDSTWGDEPTIRGWHLIRHFSDTGYHLVYCNGYKHSNSTYDSLYDGLIQDGRNLDFSNEIEWDEIAAHALGYNKNSVGNCLIGVDKFSVNQYTNLYHAYKMFKAIVPGIELIGHYETSYEQKKLESQRKTCPNIDMNILREMFNSKYADVESQIQLMLKVA